MASREAPMANPPPPIAPCSGTLSGQGEARNGHSISSVSHNNHNSSTAQDSKGFHWPAETNRSFMELSVMTLNILAQRYIESHQQLYRQCVDPKVTQWNYRKNLLKQTFEDNMADVICTQEVERAHYSDTLEPYFRSIGYMGFISIKSDDVSEGCAMFYNPRRLALKSIHQLHLFRPDISPKLSRNNVAILATFEGSAANQSGVTRFHVATTHLLFNPNRGDVKLAQIRLLMAQLEKMSRRISEPSSSQNTDRNCSYEDKSGHYPIILCGDFNMEPDSPLSHFIRSGTLNTFDLKLGDLSGQKESKGHGHIVHLTDLSFKNLDQNGRLIESLNLSSPVDTATASNSQKATTSNHSSGSSSSSNKSNGQSQNEAVVSDHDEYLIRQPLPLRSVFRSHTKNGEMNVTTHHSLASAMVDYIFYHSPLDRLQVIRKKKMMSERQMREMGCLPNYQNGSDHLPLWALFRLTHENSTP